MNGSVAAELTVKIWMPVFIGDYLADTSRLSTRQHGAYLLLMFDYWRSGPPPDNDEVLRQIAKVDRKEWAKDGSVVKSFFQSREGKLHHARLDALIAEASRNRANASLRGRHAALARWHPQEAQRKPIETESNAGGFHTHSYAPSNADALPEDSPSSSSTPSTPTQPQHTSGDDARQVGSLFHNVLSRAGR